MKDEPAAALLDFRKPIGVLLIGILQLIPAGKQVPGGLTHEYQIAA